MEAQIESEVFEYGFELQEVIGWRVISVARCTQLMDFFPHASNGRGFRRLVSVHSFSVVLFFFMVRVLHL